MGLNGLTPIAGSAMDLPGGSSAIPHDIRFSLDGTRVLVTEDGTNRIDIFDLYSEGVPTAVHSQPSAGQGPFGLKFGRNGVLLSTEATSNSVSSYILTSSGMLSTISPAVGNGQQGTCWLSVTADGKFVFVSNTGSGDLSTYSVSENGTVNLEQPVTANADGGDPIDSAFSTGDSFLYVMDSSMGRILVYRVNGASLDFVSTVTGLPTTVQGIAAQ